MSRLQIYEPRERALVTAADLALRPIGWLRRARPAPRAPIRRVLLLRLERIGDLLMVLDAIQDARATWPDAEIDLAVGSWNLPLAQLIPGLRAVETADAPWLARESGRASWPALARRARAWRRRRYDLVINFEPDVRSNFVAWLIGAPRRVGYWTGGGGALLTDASTYTPTSHVSRNARRLVARAAGLPRAIPPNADAPWPRLVPPADAVARASAILGDVTRPVVGVHASGGRESKQWHLDRFAEVARRLARTRSATIVLTGAQEDRALVDDVRRRLTGVRVVDACGQGDLATLAALIARLDLMVTGDTGPMHLAAAMGTPVVALFGPADPARYGPLAPHQHIVRVSLPCSPCNRVRLPPERCRGHVPDCMDGISVDSVVAAALDLMDAPRAARPVVVPPE
jgi:lipopolysaccharide heptosyltransferase II